MTFRDGVCERPRFATRRLTPPEFVSAYRVSGDSLKLPPGAICVTDISCAADGPMPGSLLVHGDDELLLLWAGVWFRAAPRRS